MSELIEPAIPLNPDWVFTAGAQELVSAAVWLQRDAAYLYACADDFRASGRDHSAIRIQEAAAGSAARARLAVDRAAQLVAEAK